MLQAEQILHNRYQLKQKLGQNAGRATWLADDLQTLPAESVIVKLIAFGGEVQWENLKLFEREAQVLKQLNHSRIPKYRDYFSINELTLWFGLVQSYIPGSSLKEQLAQKQKFTEKQVGKIAKDVLNILIYLHELSPPVLHRDIKPSNLIWGQDKQVYLVDFGAVQERAVQEGGTFTVVGTYGYAPMEQFGGRAVPASDLYALGATLIHLLTGTAPADLPSRDLRIHFGDRVSLSPNFMHWLEQLTAPALERRFSTARQALKALRSGLTSTSKVPNHNSIEQIPTKSAKIRQPNGTRVKVSNSPDELLIQIPGLYTSEVLIKYIIFIVLGSLPFFGFSVIVVFGWFISLISFFSLALGVLLSSPEFLPTYVKFNRTNFEIYQRSIGYKFRKQQQFNSAIEDVFPDNFGRRRVTIQAGIKEYSFGEGLSRAECNWLAQEIKDWLGIR